MSTPTRSTRRTGGRATAILQIHTLERRRVSRPSLFNLESDQSQTLRQQDEEDQEHQQQEKEIASEMPDLDEEDAKEKEVQFNFADLARDENIIQDTDGTFYVAIAGSNIDEETEEAEILRVAVKEGEELTPEIFCAKVTSNPEAALNIVRQKYDDHRISLLQVEALEKANTLNLQKVKQLKEAVVSLRNYESKFNEYRQYLKTAETERDEAKAAKARAESMVDAVNQRCTALEAKYKAQGKRPASQRNGSSRGRQEMRPARPRPERSEASVSAERRRTGRAPGGNDPDDSDDSSHDGDGHSRRPLPKQGKKKPKKKVTIDDSDYDLIDGPDVTSQYTNVDPSLSEAIKPTKGIPDPSKFSGDKATSFLEWLRAIENKLSGAKFRAHKDAMMYVQGFTSGSPWQYINSRIPSRLDPSGGDKYDTIDELLEDLIVRYGERNVADKKLTSLEALQQGEAESFSDFYIQWRTMADHLPLKNMEKTMLYNRLNARYMGRIIGGIPSTLRALVDKCYQIQDDFQMFDTKFPKKRATAATGGAKNGSSGTGSGSGSGTNTGSGKDTNGKKAWSDRPQKYQGLAPLTPAIVKASIDANKCVKCEETGHRNRAPECPLGDYQRRPQVPNYLALKLAAAPKDGKTSSSSINATVEDEEQGNVKATV